MKYQATSVLHDTIDQVVGDGVRRGLGHLSTEDHALNGRTVRVAGRDLLNLGTASYLHLERHPALVRRAHEMLDRYGTQFSASRAYLQLGLYDELEANLSRIFGQPTLAAASTTLGHLSAIPVLVHDTDVVILDQQVHSSIQNVVQLLKARGVPLHVIRHNRLDELERRILHLRNKHRSIWYFADGIYSMFGDGAPATELHALMDRYPQLHCYVDDAHGFGWTGEHGCGWFRSRLPFHHPQLTLAVSLNKAYASGGGALVFSDEATCRRVRNCGPTFIFCGPIQPPMLGSALAATELHLSADITPLQDALRARIDHCREGLVARGLPQVEANDTPLYFVPTGMPAHVKEVAARLTGDGFYVNLGIFPAVPTSMGGIRFHVHRALSFDDIDRFLDRLAVHHRDVLRGAGVTRERLARRFRMPHLAQAVEAPAAAASPGPKLVDHCTSSMAEVPEGLWDAPFAGTGPFSHRTLRDLAPAFDADPHHTTRFFWIEDADGRTVLATFYTVGRMKEDMFSPAEVSARVESRRSDEGEDFLVAKAVVLGLPITLGRHLYVDRSHPESLAAVRQLVAHLVDEKEKAQASRILLREFDRGADPELARVLLDLGLVEVEMPDMMTLESVTWRDRAGHLAALKGRYRREVRKEILPFLDSIRTTSGPLTQPSEVDEAYALYRQVHARSLALNVHALPRQVFETMVRSSEFDVLRFWVTDPDSGTERLGAVMLSHVRDQRYTALLVGYDEALRDTHALYKCALFLTVERAVALGSTSINLAFTADVVKRKVGAKPRPTCAYALVDDTFGANVLMNI